MPDNSLEISSWAAGHLLLTFDETGYGCIAGSMFVAGVTFQHNFNFSLLSGLNDSKKMSEKSRFAMESLILQHCLWSCCREVTAAEIDAGSPYHMRFSIAQDIAREFNMLGAANVIMDGNVSLNLPQAHSSTCLVKGDSKCLSIAAASVLAKCAKDRQMIALSDESPVYGWASNKGYESQSHGDAILKFGLSRHHRKSYCKKYLGAKC